MNNKIRKLTEIEKIQWLSGEHVVKIVDVMHKFDPRCKDYTDEKILAGYYRAYKKHHNNKKWKSFDLHWICSRVWDKIVLN